MLRSAVFCLALVLPGSTVLLLCGCKPRLAKNAGNSQENQLQDTFNELDAGGNPVETARVYPIRRSIHNKNGQTLEGVILAKNGDNIRFRRDVDGREFEVSLFQLSVDDQLDLANLPDETLEELEAATEPNQQSESQPPQNSLPDMEDRLKLGADLFLHDSFDSAKEMAKETGRPILLIFTGIPYVDEEDSESVANGTKSKRESESVIRTILGDSSFGSFANNHLEVVHVDFLDEDSLSKEKQRANNSAAGTFSVSTFPLAVLLNQNNYEIARIEDFGPRGANVFIDLLEEALEKQ